jgi:hypothetical protein
MEVGPLVMGMPLVPNIMQYRSKFKLFLFGDSVFRTAFSNTQVLQKGENYLFRHNTICYLFTGRLTTLSISRLYTLHWMDEG